VTLVRRRAIGHCALRLMDADQRKVIVMDVRLDLYPSAERGAYTVVVKAAPEGVASPADIPGRSADLFVDAGEAASPAADAQSIAFTFWTPSVLGRSVTRQPDRVLYVYLYSAPDAEAMAAFDRRITEEYTSYYATQGIHYSGLLRASGARVPPLAEFLAIEATTLEAAEQRLARPLPERITSIEDECRTLQDRASTRYVIWLIPR
jgi:hypothetical protein